MLETSCAGESELSNKVALLKKYTADGTLLKYVTFVADRTNELEIGIFEDGKIVDATQTHIIAILRRELLTQFPEIEKWLSRYVAEYCLRGMIANTLQKEGIQLALNTKKPPQRSSPRVATPHGRKQR